MFKSGDGEIWLEKRHARVSGAVCGVSPKSMRTSATSCCLDLWGVEPAAIRSGNPFATPSATTTSISPLVDATLDCNPMQSWKPPGSSGITCASPHTIGLAAPVAALLEQLAHLNPDWRLTLCLAWFSARNTRRKWRAGCAPYPGPKGQEVFESVSKQAWGLAGPPDHADQ